SRPTAKKGRNSDHQGAAPAVWKVQPRFSWKFHRIATTKAPVEKTWYHRTLKRVIGRERKSSSTPGPSRFRMMSTSRLTSTPDAPTAAKRRNNPTLRRLRWELVSGTSRGY